MAETKVTKTLRQQIKPRPHLATWYKETKTLFNAVVAFYFDVYQANPALVDGDDWLKQAEKQTHATKDNPNPSSPLTAVIDADIPAMLRRSAISTARGAYQSFASNLERWQKEKLLFELKPSKKGKKRTYNKRPPVPPRVFNFNPSFYSGMSKDRAERAVMVKLWSGSAWQWIKLGLESNPCIGWEYGSPVIVVKRGHLWLHTPIQRKIQKPEKLAEQVKQNRLERLCSVDLNLDGPAAVCVILSNDGTPVATKFIRRTKGLDDRRKCLLGTIATKRQQTGIIAENEQDNARRWRKIRDLDDNEAHRISRRIVGFAKANNASVIVFEHLSNLKPAKGKYSVKSNTKRAYWLKGKIIEATKYKAWHESVIVSRVSAKDTSRLCPGCHAEVSRYNAGEAPVGYQIGASLVLCPSCLVRGNADRSAAINIGHKFLNRYYPGQFWPTREKPQSIEVLDSSHDVNFYV